jgi:cytochrome c oxidase assembly protein subunit 15
LNSRQTTSNRATLEFAPKPNLAVELLANKLGPNFVINNPWLHRYSLLVAIGTLGLVAEGAAVTTRGAGLSIPDWPLAYGTLLPPVVGLAKLQLVHRVTGAVAIGGVIWLGIWVCVRDRRSWVKWLGASLPAVMIAEVLLGGAAVLMQLPKAISVLHACLAHLCLGIAGTLAMATGPGWLAPPGYVQDYGWPTLRSMAVWTPVLVFLQILLGALYRHRVTGVIPHILGAMFVTGIVLLFSLFVLTQFPKHEPLKRAAMIVLLTVFVQVMLGVFTYMSRLAGGDELARGLAETLVTVAHVATGGVLFVCSILLGIQIRRHVLPKSTSMAGASVQALS